MGAVLVEAWLAAQSQWNSTVGYVHKTTKKTQRERVIYLAAAGRRNVEKLVHRHPHGPTFRTQRIAKWSLTSLCNKWQWLRQICGTWSR